MRFPPGVIYVIVTLAKLVADSCSIFGPANKFFSHSNLNTNVELPLPIIFEKKMNSFFASLIFIGVFELPEKN